MIQNVQFKDLSRMVALQNVTDFKKVRGTNVERLSCVGGVNQLKSSSWVGFSLEQ